MTYPKFKINDNVFVYETSEKKIFECKIIAIQIFIDSFPEYKSSTDGTKGLINTGNFKPKNIEVSYKLKLRTSSPSIFDVKMIKEDDLYFSVEELKSKITEKIQSL